MTFDLAITIALAFLILIQFFNVIADIYKRHLRKRLKLERKAAHEVETILQLTVVCPSCGIVTVVPAGTRFVAYQEEP